MFIIGDVHGCLKTLQALIDKLPDQKEIVFVGDLVDRGPSSPEVLDFVRSHPEWLVVRGNHEDMMLDYYKGYYDLKVKTCLYPPNTWMRNGGEPDRYTKEQIEWVASWPLYLEFPELQDDQGNHLFVSHAAPYYEDIEDCLNFRAWHLVDLSLLWNRLNPRPRKDCFLVYGHNAEPKVELEDHYAMIDTACVYQGESWLKGKKTSLTALEFPSKKVFSQENIDPRPKRGD